MLVGPQLVGAATVPLNRTVPGAVPKFAPVIVTEVPTAPDVGFTLVIAGTGVVTENVTPLLAAPFTVTTTGPVVAPAGTGATTLVAFQLVGAATVPLNRTVPGAVPKFAPVIVTEVPTAPDVGFTLVIAGIGPPPPTAGRNAARAAPQVSELFSVPLADTGPAVARIRSSTTSFVLGATGTRSWMTYPLPAVNVLGSAVERTPITRSPLAVVVTVPVPGALLVPCAVAVTSREFAVATPEYSRIAKRSVPPEIESDTLIVFAPPAILSA